MAFAGDRGVAETGLYHYRARYYSPALGRFLTADPIGYGDGLNVYAYVANDPVTLVDPSGLGAEQNRTTNSSFFEVGPVIPPNNDAILIVLTDDSRSIDGPLALFSLSGASTLYKGVSTGRNFVNGFRTGTVSSSPVRQGAPVLSVRNTSPSRPLLGNNPRTASGRTNTDLSPFNARAVAKSIYRHITKDLNVKSFTTKGGGIRRRAQDGTQIRMNPDGSTRIDLPHRGPQPNGETIHFNP